MKKILWGSAIVIIASIIIIACQKNDTVTKQNTSFDVSASKEWWYGSFRKSAEYNAIDYNSLFAPSEKDGIIATKKYPNWKDGISYAAGSLQIVELPLVYNYRVSIFPGSERIDKNERIRIAAASLNKLLLIKKPDNSIALRTVLLIPSPEYARQKNYDISNNSLQKPDPHFSGWLVVKDWKETIINYWQIEDGKKVRKMKLLQKEENLKAKQNGGVVTDQEICFFVQVTKTNRLCVHYFITGDQPPTEEDCTEWYEYEYQEFEFVCQDEGNGGGPEDNGCTLGMTQEECACIFLGIGCGDDDNGGIPENYELDQTQAHICGTYNWGTIGNAWYTRLQSVGFTLVNTNGQILTFMFSQPCIQFSKSSTPTTSQANQAWNVAWNNATDKILLDVNAGGPIADWLVKQKMKNYIQTYLNSNYPGSTFNPTGCTGTMPWSSVQYCP